MKILFLQTNYPGFLDDFYKKTNNWEELSYSQLKKKWTQRWFGNSNFYSKHLKDRGWNANEFIVNDWNLQSKWASENGLTLNQKNINLPKFIPESIKNTLGLRQWVKKVLFAQIKKNKPEVVYIFDLSLLGISELRQIKKRVRLLVAQTATVLPPNQRKLKEYDLIISSFPHYVSRFKQSGIKSEYLKWCTEKSIPEKIGYKRKKYEVVYIGAFTPAHSKGNKALEKLAKATKVDFWGYGEKTLIPGSQIKKTFHGNAWGRDMYEIYARSKIVVNRHINVSENYANNMRMFEATGMGALLITEDKPNMKDFFEVGKEVITYKNNDDLIDKVKYFIDNPLEREKIAIAGQNRTLKDHSYEVRMKELNKILNKYL